MEIKNNQSKLDWSLIITCIICIILGITMIIYNKQTSEILSFVAGAVLVICGIIRIIMYFVNHESGEAFSFTGISLGLTLISIGACIFLSPDILTSILPKVMGCFLIFIGFTSLHSSIIIAKRKVKLWYLELIFSIITIAIGFFSLINPMNISLEELTLYLGIFLCVEAAMLIVSHILFVVKAPKDHPVSSTPTVSNTAVQSEQDHIIDE